MKPLMTFLLSLLLLPFLTLSCGYSRQAQPPTAPLESRDNEMSEAFREQAHRALDAIDRLPSVSSRGSTETWPQDRQLDAEKAIDEAKYKVQTAKDKEVLKILNAAFIGRTSARHRWTTDPGWKRVTELGRQCILELKIKFEPEGWSEDDIAAATTHPCLTQLAEHDAITTEELRKMGVPSP